LLPLDSRKYMHLVIPAGVDNQAIHYLSRKQSSTKFPLAFVLMQTAVLQGNLNLRMDLQWRPRESNAEADSLTNQDFKGFDPTLRINADWKALHFTLLDKLKPHLQAFLDEVRFNRVFHRARIDDHTKKKRKVDKTKWGD
jgi:hypothetical protein